MKKVATEDRSKCAIARKKADYPVCQRQCVSCVEWFGKVKRKRKSPPGWSPNE